VVKCYKSYSFNEDVCNKTSHSSEFRVSVVTSPPPRNYVLFDYSNILTQEQCDCHVLNRWLDDEIWRGGYDVSVKNVTDSMGCIGLAGPLSRQVLKPLLDRSNDEDLSEDRWPFLHARRQLNVAGVITRAVRISYTGELGWELYADRADMPRLYDALTQSPSVAAGDFGTYAMNALRIEKGFRAWGSEMNIDTDPFEAGLGPFVRLDKPANFIGKESLKSILVAADRKHQPGRRRLVQLTLTDSGPDIKNAVDPNGNEAVWFGDRVVGNTTSGSFCPTIGRAVAFAYVPMELSAHGTEVQIELLGERRLATVEKGPPVKIESIRTRKQKRRTPSTLAETTAGSV
jgi:dimethylglycine dehydrogenase